MDLVVAKVPRDESDSDLNVVMARGMKMTCEVHLEELKDRDFDMIVTPGGIEGSENLGKNATLV